MAINKVKYGNQTLIDLTDTTATADKILTGFGAYGKDGVWMDGSAETGSGAVADDISTLAGGGEHHNVYGVDLTLDTVAANKMLSGTTAHDSAGNAITGNIATKTNSDLTASGATVTVPAGYYASQATKSVSSGTAGTPTATKGTVSNHSVSVTPSVTNTTGYITGGTKTGTAVTVSASELVSGTLTIDSSGTKDVTNYASVSVNAGTATNSGTASVGGATVTAGTNSITLSKSVPITPDVTAGYISSGTSGNVSVSLTGSVTTKGATTYTPTTTSQTIASGTYLTGTQTISGDSNLVASNIKKDVTIFGITGTAEPTLVAKTVTPTAETQVVSATNTTYIRFEAANPTSIGSNTRYWDVYRRGGSTWYYYVDNDIVLGETYHIEVSFYRSGYNRTYTAELDTIISSFPFDITIRASSGQTSAITLNTISNGYRFSNNLYGDEDTPANDTLTVSITQVADGLSQVTVNGDADLVASNIKKDVDIFGVTGTYDPEPSLIAKTVTPTAETQIVTPTSTSTVLVSDSLNNYYELKAKTTSDSSVYKCRNFVIPAEMAETFSTFPNTYHLYLSFAKRTCPYAYAEYGKVIIDTDLTFTSRSDVITIPISDSDNWMTNVVVSITSSTILHMVFNFNSDVVSSLTKPCIYIVNPDATFNSQYGWYASASATADEYDEAKYLYNYATQTYYGLSQVTVNGDADLVAGNIKKDVNIFGVTGTYEGGGGDLSTATVTLINNVAWPGPSIIATGAIVEDDPDFPLSVINAWCSTGATNAIQVIMFKGRAEIKVEEENSSTATITYTGSCEPGYGGTYIVTGDCTFTMAR